MTRAALWLAWLLVTLVSAAGAAAEPATWTSIAARSQILVHVHKRGLLSGLAHDHRFLVTRWQASATLDPGAAGPGRVEVVIAASSLRDTQASLSAQDREAVNRQAAGPGTLDADRFPEIRFAADRVVPSMPGTALPGGQVEVELAGTLSLHGGQRRLTVPVRATRDGTGWRVQGTVTLRQSDFAIEPFSAFAGTVGVRDEVEIEYDLAMAPALTTDQGR